MPLLALLLSDPTSITFMMDCAGFTQSVNTVSLIEHTSSWVALIAWTLAIQGHLVSMGGSTTAKTTFKHYIVFYCI